MTENTATAPVAPTVDVAAAANAKLASDILSRVHDKFADIDRAFSEFDVADTDGPYPAALKASKAFGLTPAEIAAWRPGSRKEVSDDPIENAIRSAHLSFKPESAPATRYDFSRVLRLLCHAAKPSVVATARGEGPGEYRQKNLPQVSDKSRAEAPELATPEAALAGLKKEVAKLSNAITFRVNPIDAVDNPEAIATLNKQLATMQVQGGLFQASLLLKFVENEFDNACKDRGVAPAKVWRDAAQKAKAALAKAGKEATQDEILKAMRDAVVLVVGDNSIKEVEVKAVRSEADLIAAASNALFAAMRRLLALGVLDQMQYDAISEVTQRHGVTDEVGDKLAEDEAKRVRKEADARLKAAEDEKRRLEQEAANAAKPKAAPVQASEASEAAAAPPVPKRQRAKFAPAPVEPVDADDKALLDAGILQRDADAARDAALEELDNA